MNAVVIEATYQNGVLRPDGPLPLKDNERVRITVESATSWAERTYGIVKWTGDAETLEQFATAPELDFPPPPDEP
jgi:predicted DNA-binding antitoxin AbrB/MazE fold protein